MITGGQDNREEFLCFIKRSFLIQPIWYRYKLWTEPLQNTEIPVVPLLIHQVNNTSSQSQHRTSFQQVHRDSVMDISRHWTSQDARNPVTILRVVDIQTHTLYLVVEPSRTCGECLFGMHWLYITLASSGQEPLNFWDDAISSIGAREINQSILKSFDSTLRKWFVSEWRTVEHIWREQALLL